MSGAFGLPGDGINGIMEGLRRHQDRVRFVLVHHEEAAAFMATAHSWRRRRAWWCGHYDVSVACAEHGLWPAVRDASPDTAILADGFSCRTQIETGHLGRRERTAHCSDEAGDSAARTRAAWRTRWSRSATFVARRAASA